MGQKSENLVRKCVFISDAKYQNLRPIFAAARKKYLWKSGYVSTESDVSGLIAER